MRTGRLAPLALLLMGLAVIVAAVLIVPWAVQAQDQEVTPTADATGSNPPAKPTNLQATAEHDAVALTWTASTDQTVTHYAVLRRNRDEDATGVFHVIEQNAGPETSYEDRSVAAESGYNYRVKAVSPTGVSAWSGYVKADTPAAPPATATLTPTPTDTPEPEPESSAADQAPAGLSAALVEGGGVTLSWSAPTEEAASVTGYEVLRAVGDAEFSTLVSNTGSTATAYTDATATDAGETYAYRVKAIRGSDRSQASGEAEVQLPHDPADLRPTGLTVSLVDNQVTLSWTAPAEEADSVTGYEILRRRPMEGESALATLVADTESTATTYTDATANEAGVQYVYRVKALRGSDVSLWSNFAKIELPSDYVAPQEDEPESTDADEAPAGLSAALAEGGGVSLSWSAPSEDAGSVTGYEVLRAVGEGELATLVADTASTTTTYTDATATEAGETYAYQVKAIRGEARSEASGQAEVQLPHDPVDLAPTGLTALILFVSSEGNTSYSVHLTWTAPAEDTGSVTGYEVLRAVGEGALATLVDDTGSTATSYTDATATDAGETYAYQVKAIRGEDRSQASGQARVQLPHASADLAPSDLTAAAVDGGGVDLSWSAPAEDADSVTGYEILHAVGEGDMATLVADTSSTATSYTDATATEAGESYTYEVKAIRGEERSQASGEAQVQVPHDAVDLAASPADAPTGLAATLAAGAGAVYLTWDDPSLDVVTGYRVLRRDRDVDAADSYTTLVENTSDSAVSFADDSVMLGAKYGYQVIALIGETASDASTAVEIDLPTATDIGDITPHGSSGTQTGASTAEVYYTFNLTDVREVSLTLNTQSVGIHLHSSTGALLSSGANEGDGQARSAVLRAGDYRIRIAVPAGSGTQSYELGYSVNGNISESGTVEFSHDSQTLGRAQVGDTITGRHDAVDDNVGGSSGDDWVGVELERGVRYAVVVRSRNPSTIWDVLTWQTSAVQHDYEHADGTEYVMHGLNREDVWVGYQEAILTPRRSGLFFFRVSTSPYYSERWKGTPPYTFTVVRVEDDFRETRTRDDQGRAYAAWEIGPGQHGRVEVGGSMLGRIDWVRWSEDYDIEYNHDRLWQGGDTDWIAVDLTAGRVYQVDIESVVVPGSQVGPWPDPNLYTIVLPGPQISVFNSADDEDSGDGRNARALYRAPKSGTYYLVVSPDASSRYNRFLGDYRVSVTDVTPTEPDLPNNTSTTARLSIDGTKVNGFFEKSSDHDWYVVAMEAGRSHKLRAHGTFGRDHIIDEVVGIGGIRFGDESKPLPGTRWDGDYWHHRTMEIVFTPTRTGDYYIDLGHNACCGDDVRMIGPYEVSVTEVESLDADSFAEITAKSATVDQSIRGTVKFPPNDSDAWFSVELEAGTEYETALSNSGEVFRRAIYKSDGTIIAGSNTGTFTPKEAGTYYVRIGGQPGHGTRSFSLTIQEPPEDPAAVVKTPEETLWESFDSANAVSLTLGETTDASIETAEEEHDWFQLDLTGGEGKTYYLDLANAANGGNAYTLGLPYLRAVYDSDGNALSHDRDGGNGTGSYEFQPTEDATYYVVVRSREDFTSNSRGTGTYGVRVIDTTPPSDGDLPHDPSTTGVLEVGGSVIGEIDAEGDVDWYKVTLVGGVTYQFDMKGKSSGEWVLVDGAPAFVTLGTLVDPKLLGVYGGDSILIAGSDSEVNGTGKDSRIASFTPSTDGEYYIAASAESGWTGTYELSFTVTAGQHVKELSLTTDNSDSTAKSVQSDDSVNSDDEQLVDAIKTIVKVDNPVVAKQVVQAVGGFQQVDAGWRHACALRTDGTLECWGAMENLKERCEGGPYDGRWVCGRQADTPEGIFTQVVAGFDRTCGIRDDGSATCWERDYQPDGSGPKQQINTNNLEGVCWLNADGTVDCGAGMAGPPSSGTYSSISVGSYIACAINSDDEAVCWSNHGARTVPTGTFKFLQVGGYRVCGIRSDSTDPDVDGTVLCWRYGDHSLQNKFAATTGQDSAENTSYTEDEQAAPTDKFQHLQVHYTRTCGVTEAGQIKCWTRHGGGLGTLLTSLSGLTATDFKTVSIDWYPHACALRTDSTITCWGFSGNEITTPAFESPWKDNARLLKLEFSGIDFAFDRDTARYTLSVGNDVASTTVTTGATNNQATVAISPTDVDSSTDGHQVNLSPGPNTITVTVTAADGVTTQAYTIVITRASS